jgi:hypothetical protein
MRLCVVIALCCLAVNLPGKPSQAAGAKQKPDQAPGQTTITLENYEDSKAHPAESDSNPAKWYTSFERPEWWLVAAAFLTIFFIGWQSIETRKAAEAAKSSAESVRKAERAWLIIKPDSFLLQPGNRLDWIIVNAGQTTATISKAQVRCKKYRGMEILLTGPPDYGDPINLLDVPIAPNIPIKVWSYIETDTGNRLSPEDVVDISDKGADLVAYCFVEYLDSFGDPHESRFCYYYANPWKEFRINLRAPADYHKCT